jgi:putative transposase
MSLFHKRQGQMENEEIYFYTDTINGFYHLLKNDEIKAIIINSLKYLVENKLAVIYGYVIMPNHIHLIWKTLANQNKETVVGSFTKYTGHQFKKYLEVYSVAELNYYQSIISDRQYHFWKRDPLAIFLNNIAIIQQKLDYIHCNPIQEKWKLCDLPENYRWSSARFYQDGFDEFGILTHYRD